MLVIGTVNGDTELSESKCTKNVLIDIWQDAQLLFILGRRSLCFRRSSRDSLSLLIVHVLLCYE